MSEKVVIRRGFVDIGGGLQVHYRTAGEAVARPLVLLHPSPGSSKMLEPLIAAFSETRLVYALDTLGNGDSSAPEGDAPDITYFTQGHMRAIDALGLAEFDIHGGHTGGNVACEIAIAWPERVRHLILDGMSLYSDAERADMLANYAPPLRIAADASHILWAWNFVRNAFLFWPWYKTDAAHVRNVGLPSADALHDKFVEVIKAARTFHKSYNAAIAYDKRPRLPLVAVPTMLACAKTDMLLPYMDRVGALMPHAERFVFRGMRGADKRETIGRMTAFLDDKKAMA